MCSSDLYLPPQTLQKGTAVHKLKLPMYVGSVRVMVVAGHDGAYGNVEKTVPVKSPLMVVSSLPRVLSPGEKVSLPVNVFALEDKIREGKRLWEFKVVIPGMAENVVLNKVQYSQHKLKIAQMFRRVSQMPAQIMPMMPQGTRIRPISIFFSLYIISY